MPISKVFVVRFFQLVKGRRFAEADRVLERIRLKTNKTEWNSGYLHALNGILLAQKSNDSYAFIKNVNFDEEKELKNVGEILQRLYYPPMQLASQLATSPAMQQMQQLASQIGTSQMAQIAQALSKMPVLSWKVQNQSEDKNGESDTDNDITGDKSEEQ